MKIMATNNNQYFKQVVEPQLKAAVNAGDMLHVLQQHYDLTKPLPTFTHLAFRQGLRQAIVLLDPDPSKVYEN